MISARIQLQFHRPIRAQYFGHPGIDGTMICGDSVELRDSDASSRTKLEPNLTHKQTDRRRVHFANYRREIDLLCLTAASTEETVCSGTSAS